MDKPFVGRGWAKDIEPYGDSTLYHMVDDDEDNFDLEYELEKAEYWADCFDDMFEDGLEALDDMRL